MFEFLMLILFVWLFCKSICLAFRLAWGTAKVIACILFALAIPVLIACLVFAGGALLLLPLGMVALAFALLSAIVG